MQETIWVSIYRDNLVEYKYYDDRFNCNVVDILISKDILMKYYNKRISPLYQKENYNNTFENWFENYNCDDTDDLIEFIKSNDEQIINYNFESYSDISLDMLRKQFNNLHLSDDELVPNYELAAECYKNDGSLMDFDCMITIQQALDTNEAIEFSDYQRVANSKEFEDKIMEITIKDAEKLRDIIY